MTDVGKRKAMEDSEGKDEDFQLYPLGKAEPLELAGDRNDWLTELGMDSSQSLI